MADAILLTKGKDPTKANPRKYEDYTVKFPKMMENYNGLVTVKFRHIDAQAISQCYDRDSDGNPYLSDFAVFKKCVKEVHGLKQPITRDDGTEEWVELTPDDIVHYTEMTATAEDGTNAMSIMFAIVHDVAQAILMKSVLTEEEEKNLSRDAKRSTLDS